MAGENKKAIVLIINMQVKTFWWIFFAVITQLALSTLIRMAMGSRPQYLRSLFFITVIILTSTLIVENTHKESQKGKGTSGAPRSHVKWSFYPLPQYLTDRWGDNC